MNNPSLTNGVPWRNNNVPAINLIGDYSRVSILRKTVLWTVGAYLILGQGFELVRIPPVGAGIPVGEVMLILCLLLINPLIVLPMMATEVWLFPILVWWGMSLSRALVDTSVGGVWSFRDASQAIESLYLIVGFWLANSPENLRYFFSWLRKLLIIYSFYGLLLPVSKTLQNYSPNIPGVAAGSSSHLLFQMTSAPEMLLWTACWLLTDTTKNRRTSKLRIIAACLMVAFSVAYAQVRTIYVGVLMIGVILLLFKKKMATKWGAILLLGFLIIGAISVSGVQLTGGRGHKISLDFIMQHFEAISGSSGSEDVEGSAAGVGQRVGWYRQIFTKMKESPEKMVFGLGYGIPLTDFHATGGIVVREPHDSYVSVVGRLGISGLMVWILMQGALYFSWWRSFKLCRRMNWTSDLDNLILLLIFSGLTFVVAIGEDGFEKPYWAIPYYLFFGVVLRYGRHLRHTAVQAARSVS